MPQFVFDIRSAGGAFEVHLLNGTGAAVTDAAGVSLVRPMTPLDAAQEAVLARIVERAPVGTDMFGFGRLLFDKLVGAEWWRQIYASDGFIDLTVVCDRIPALARLPWEMMAAPDDRFIAQIPQIGIVRRISGSKAVFGPFPAPPTVLVAVGSELHRDVIRPAAECFALLNNLRGTASPIHLRTHLLLRATPQRIKTAVRTFKPQVVHLICHGEVDDTTRRGHLTLVSDQGAGSVVEAYAETLLEILECDGALPSILVLSACYTAAASLADVGQVATPLAQELAARIPLVVGMSGAITDQACRLFARRFYESLLSNGAVAQASADGRRAALTGLGSDPRITADWTMPIVCVSEKIGAASVPVEPPAAATLAWRELALQFEAKRDIVFCDRVEVMDLYDLLMAPSPAQRRIRPDGTDLQVLTFQADIDASNGRRYGITRVIRELAGKAARDGHVPVLVQGMAPQWPKTRQELLPVIVEACQHTADSFHLDRGICRNLSQLLSAGDRPMPDTIDAALLERFPGKPASDRLDVLATAMRLDLIDLLNLVRASRAEIERPEMRLLLLVDDVHCMNEAAVNLASGLLGVGGLRRASDDIRVAVTYMTQGGNPRAGESAAVEAVKSLNDQNWVANVVLGAFRQPDEDRHAYERFLLHWSDGTHNGLALRSDAPEFVASFWQMAAEDISGVPSLLQREGPRLVKVFLRMPPQGQILRPANDDDLLRQAALARR